MTVYTNFKDAFLEIKKLLSGEAGVDLKKYQYTVEKTSVSDGVITTTEQKRDLSADASARLTLENNDRLISALGAVYTKMADIETVLKEIRDKMP